MDLSIIKSQLEDALIGSTLVLGSASLSNGTGLEAESVKAIITLFEASLDAAQVKIQYPSISLINDATALVLTGFVSMLGIENADVKITLSEEDEGPAFRMTVALPPGWNMIQSFPQISSWMDGSPLEQVYFTNATLVFSTTDYCDEKLGIEITNGLNLTADVGLDGPFEMVKTLVNYDGSLLHLYGWISLTKDPLKTGEDSPENEVENSQENEERRYPLFKLRANLETEAEFGPFTLKGLGIELQNGYLPADNEASEDKIHMTMEANLTGKVDIASMTMAASILIPSEPDEQLELRLSFAGVESPGLGEVAYLLGSDGFTLPLPDGLQDAGRLELTEIALNVLPEGNRITQASLEMETAEWVLIEDILTVEKIEMRWEVFNPTRPIQRKFSGSISGGLIIEDGLIKVAAKLPEGKVTATLEEGNTISVVGLLEKWIPDLSVPDGVTELAIGDLDLNLDLKAKTYHLEGKIDRVWEITTEFGDFGIECLGLSLERTSSETIVQFGGVFELLDADFMALVKYEAATWHFIAGLAPENEINISTLVAKVGLPFEEAFGVEKISITELMLEFSTGPESFFNFRGAGAWSLALPGMDDIDLTAGLEIKKVKDQEVSGKVFGSLATAVEFFENLQVTVTYEFGQQQKLIAELTLGKFTLEASLEKTAAETILTFDTSKSNLTFGDILTFLAGLVDPGIEEFSLEPPWNELDSIPLPDLKLEINFTDKSAKASIPGSITILEVLTIKNPGLTYQSKNGERPNGFKVSFDWSYAGQTQSESWDPLNDPAPPSPVPSKSVLELDYLGLGQHIALYGSSQYVSVEQVVNALQLAVLDDGSGKLLVYSRDSQWLIGTKFTVMDTLEMSVIFNDPVFYGMLIQLHGEKAKLFAGLRFEILYRRITDTIGVYHTELTLPDEMRHFDVGAVAITLPVVAVDIFTNGDFAVDVGFPWKGDWSRSALAEAGIFTGRGGFYFAKLSGATAMDLPNNGENFGLVLKFGLGLRLGLGRSFERGPLKAELSLTIQGIFEGVLAWYHIDKSETELYYRLQASVQLVGRLYGSVDFAVIQVQVEVIIYAGIQMAIEAYKAIQIVLVAGVSVRASIKVLFIRIHFSFSLTLRETFKIGSDDDANAPWNKGVQFTQSLPAGQTLRTPAAMAFHTTSHQPLWDPNFKVWDHLETLNLLFRPAFTEGLDSDQLGNPGSGTSEVKGIALLFIGNAIQDSADVDQVNPLKDLEVEETKSTGFSLLTKAVLAWALQVPPSQKITLQNLTDAHNAIQPGKNTFSFEQLMAFLEANFCFQITSSKPVNASVNATVFPMFPQLTLLGSDGETVLADYTTANRKTSTELKSLLTYFEGLRFGSVPQDTTGLGVPRSIGKSISMATFVFVDYFAMLTRSALQSAIDHLRETGQTTLSFDELFDGMVASRKIDNLAGIVSRFMLYGLRLPFSLPLSDDTKTYPLYELTGQQFTVPSSEKTQKDFNLTLKSTDPKQSTWLKFDKGSALKIDIDEQEAAFITALEDLTFTPALKEAVPLPLYRWIPRRFNFSQRQLTQDKAIWPFPADLVSHLMSLGGDEHIELKVSTGRPTETGQNALEIEPLSEYDWGTLVEFSVRRLPMADGTGFLENTYLVASLGGRDANASSEDYLEEVIASVSTGASASLGYEYTASELETPAGATFFLLRTNLAGGTGESTVIGADQESVGDLSRLLWMAGKTEGGTYLHFTVGGGGNGLPDSIFDSSGTAILRLLILEEALTVGRRHNCLVTAKDIDPEKVALFAETTAVDERVKALSVKPGHVGFRITRQPIELNPSDDQWSDELDNLFQLLSYRLIPNDNFWGSRWGMPVGPTVDLNDPDNPNDDLWIYERVIPAYRFAQKPVDAQNGLPPASENPYAGIGKDAQVEFEFLDVYGNRTTSARANTVNGVTSTDDQPALLPMALRVGYSDDIIGLKAWPGAVLKYGITSDDHIPCLNLSLGLNIAGFTEVETPGKNGGDTRICKIVPDKVKTARAAYQQIYYQVHQGDLKFFLSTSLNPALSEELDKNQFTDFVDQAYLFFDHLFDLVNDNAALPKFKLSNNGEVQVVSPVPGALPSFPTAVLAPISLSRAEGKLNKNLIFPFTVQITMQRDTDLIHPDFNKVNSVQQVIMSLAPPADADGKKEPIVLRAFATDFEKAFPGLKLMSGRVDDDLGKTSLWVVHFGRKGIDYQIDSGDRALFFAPAPLSNRLLSGDVDLKSYTSGQGLTSSGQKQRFNGVDLDTWSREFLAAVDAFLEADFSVPAYRVAKDKVDVILDQKSKLAEAIAAQVRPIILGNEINTDNQRVAADVFKKQVLTHLENAYTIETIVQLGVQVTLNHPPANWKSGRYPRLSVKPLTLNLDGNLDYTLSPAEIPLHPGHSTLTFLYNTPAPAEERQAEIDLNIQSNGMEFGISPVKNLPGYEDSSWLTFILPPEGTTVGKLEIPVPLRVFPTPPSLIRQVAEADADSQRSLEHIREWQYSYLYEHLDAAQDAIETTVHYNVESTSDPIMDTNAQNMLLVALANFHTLYPQLLPDLELLKGESDDKASVAVAAFAELVREVADAWAEITPPEHGEKDTGYYRIQMDESSGDNPIVAFDTNGVANSQTALNSFRVEALHGSNFGVPSIPDFKVSIDDRDIIEHQNAWAEIWVSRNRDLGDQPTHPAFIYQTPSVRFGNMLTPLLVNNKEWHIESLSTDPRRTLGEHLEQLFSTLLPEKSTQDYDLHISCGYAFALAEGDEGKPDLLVPLPVTLGPRFTVPKNTGMATAIAAIRQNLEAAIRSWWEENQPATLKGMFVFKLSILASAGNLPLLQIDDLRLSLENIIDLTKLPDNTRH